MARKPWQRGLEATGNITSTVKMQRVMSAGAQPASPFIYSAYGMVPPIAGMSLLTQANLIQMVPCRNARGHSLG